MVSDLSLCPKPSTSELVLSRSAGRRLTGTRLASTGALASASASAVVVENDQLIVVMVDGDPTDRVPIPGGSTWLRALTDRAVARAAG
jgi:hypothetical protein